jgi:Ca-activated chloride channel family protein
MKTILCSIGLAALFLVNSPARESLSVKVEPEQTKVIRGDGTEVMIKIDLTAGPAPEKRLRQPLNLAVVLDRSGSMSGAKIEKAKQAAAAVLDQMGSNDIYSLVAYDSQVQVLVPAQAIEDKERLKARIFRIQAGGSTALYGGVERGAEQLLKFLSSKKINRVILLSDGLANVGPSSTEELQSLGRRLSQKGVSVTTVGVGDDYNEDLMAGLAESSDANYYYVKDAETLPDIFRKELGFLLAVMAQEVEVEIQIAPGVEPLGFMGRPETFEKRKALVRFGPFSADQNRYLFLRARIENEKGKTNRDIAAVTVRYRDSDGVQVVRHNAAVSLTTDEKAAQLSINRTIQAQRILMANAVAKDQAMATADAGGYEEAGNKFRNQADRLSRAATEAPAAYQQPLQEEVERLRRRADEVAAGSWSKSSRKETQAEIYKEKNRK